MERIGLRFVVTFESRDDGGLCAFSDDVPGFALSHSKPDTVLLNVKPALEGILSSLLNANVEVRPLGELKTHLTQAGVIDKAGSVIGTREYVTLLAA